MGHRLATIDMGRKERSCCAPFGGGAASPSNTMSPGPRPTSVPSGILIHPSVWLQRTWTENWEQLCPFEGEAGSLSNTMWPGQRSTSVPNFTLIHPTIWPQYTNVTDRTGQTGQTDNGPTGYGEPFPEKARNPWFRLSYINETAKKR